MFLIKTAMLIHFGVYRTRFHSSQHSFPPTEVHQGWNIVMDPSWTTCSVSFEMIRSASKWCSKNGHVEDSIKIDGSLKLPWLIGSYRHVYFLIEMGYIVVYLMAQMI